MQSQSWQIGNPGFHYLATKCASRSTLAFNVGKSNHTVPDQQEKGGCFHQHRQNFLIESILYRIVFVEVILVLLVVLLVGITIRVRHLE